MKERVELHPHPRHLNAGDYYIEEILLAFSSPIRNPQHLPDIQDITAQPI